MRTTDCGDQVTRALEVKSMVPTLAVTTSMKYNYEIEGDYQELS